MATLEKQEVLGSKGTKVPRGTPAALDAEDHQETVGTKEARVTLATVAPPAVRA